MYVYNKTLGVCVMCDLCVIVHMRTANPVMEIHAFMLHSEKKKNVFYYPRFRIGPAVEQKGWQCGDGTGMRGEIGEAARQACVWV